MRVMQNSLSMDGWHEIERKTYGSNVCLVDGEDYRIKEEGGVNWLPFPDLLSLRKIRHKWMIVRNERPKVPSFCKAPMLDKRHHDEERNARIVRRYFHPFTLQETIVH